MRTCRESHETFLDASIPHTLSDFARESANHCIIPKGLPLGIRPEAALEIFLGYTFIPLRTNAGEPSYFSGWFDQPRQVRTAAGEVLFEIKAVLQGSDIAYELTLHPGAIALLG